MIDWVHKESVTQANVCDTCGHQYSDICGTCESLDGVPVQYYPKPSDVRPIKDDGIIGTLDYKTGIFTPTRRITNADRIRHMTDEELAEFIEQAICPPTTKKIYHECTKDNCVPCWLEWLKQEAT